MCRWGYRTCLCFIAFSSISSSCLLSQHNTAEHVVLANCIDNNGVRSSQMVYFSGSPGNSPDCEANVSTTYGHTRIWEDGVTSATFPDDGSTFTSNISGVVSPGAYAG